MVHLIQQQQQSKISFKQIDHVLNTQNIALLLRYMNDYTKEYEKWQCKMPTIDIWSENCGVKVKPEV